MVAELFEMSIEAESLVDPQLLHDDEAGAIREAERFVMIFFKNIPSLFLKFRIDMNGFDKAALLQSIAERHSRRIAGFDAQ